MIRDQWKRMASESVLEWYGMTLKRDDVIGPDGSQRLYTYVDHPGSVAIVPILNGNRVALVRQYRYLTKRPSLEVPAGYVEKGETLEEAAQRELGEETGYRAGTLKVIGQFFPSNSYSNELTTIFLASELGSSDFEPDPAEGVLRLQVLSWNEVLESIDRGVINDGFTLVALLLAQKGGPRDWARPSR